MTDKKKIILKTYYLVVMIFISIPFQTLFAEVSGSLSNLNSTVDSAKSIGEASQKLTQLSPQTSDTDSSNKSGNSNGESNQKISNDNDIEPIKTPMPETPGNFFDRIFGRVNAVSILVQKEANNNNSIVAEVVIVKKAEDFQNIAGTNVHNWFDERSAFIKKIKESKDVQIYRFEITPDSKKLLYYIDVNSKAMAAFLFVRLQNNQEALPYLINPYKNLYLNFYFSGFNFSNSFKE